MQDSKRKVGSLTACVWIFICSYRCWALQVCLCLGVPFSFLDQPHRRNLDCYCERMPMLSVGLPSCPVVLTAYFPNPNALLLNAFQCEIMLCTLRLNATTVNDYCAARGEHLLPPSLLSILPMPGEKKKVPANNGPLNLDPQLVSPDAAPLCASVAHPN